MNFIDPVLYQASVRPNAPAIILPDDVISYAQLEICSRFIGTHLLRAGIGPGDAVAVCLARRDLSILLTLALARLGAISIAPTRELGQATPRWLQQLGCKAVCRTENDAAVDGIASLVLGREWLHGPALLGPLPPAVIDCGTTFRITFSSGTTGSPKAMALSHGGAAQRVIENQFGLPAHASSRMLLIASVNAGFAFHSCFKHLYAGGAIVIGRAPSSFAELASIVDRNAVTQTVLSTFDLSTLLNTLPPVILSGLARTSVTFAGGPLPEPVWRRAARLFNGAVLSHYGATEAGPVAFGDYDLLTQHPGAVGRLLPWVRMEAVDENDHPLPAGEQGILRLRAPGMSSSYIDNPAATAVSFRNGWFYPGDTGIVTLDGVVRVVGRSDDVMNIGGAKIAPAKLENLVAGTDGVRDAAATVMQDPNGEQFIAIGIVADAGIDRDSVAARCREAVPRQVKINVVQMEAIPRNEAGKILRRELGARIAALRAGHGTTQ